MCIAQCLTHIPFLSLKLHNVLVSVASRNQYENDKDNQLIKEVVIGLSISKIFISHFLSFFLHQGST